MAKSKEKQESAEVLAAREKYGQCVAIAAFGTEFVFRPLELDEFEDFQAKARAGKAIGAANRECCQVALIDEKKLDALKDAMARAPGFAPVAAQAIMQMAFNGLEFTVKKD